MEKQPTYLSRLPLKIPINEIKLGQSLTTPLIFNLSQINKWNLPYDI